tara:strand:- start:6775 stop:7098 length:324 start_codon:yes stop_codon:yes gene_type:complete
MEEQIKEAKATISWSGLSCKIISFIGILGTLIYLIGYSAKEFNRNPYFWAILGTSLGSSVSIGAIGSIAESSKKNKALTALIVESTNSASQLPISNEIEYSDLNEDN